ncbi:hypothetical protein FKP32DRAFT_578253 [Trametes sanguinea]|nr:hypothetical protein FKP32DRAFT_578253 [Trametes sanguinea]
MCIIARIRYRLRPSPHPGCPTASCFDLRRHGCIHEAPSALALRFGIAPWHLEDGQSITGTCIPPSATETQLPWARRLVSLAIVAALGIATAWTGLAAPSLRLTD